MCSVKGNASSFLLSSHNLIATACVPFNVWVDCFALILLTEQLTTNPLNPCYI